MNYGSVTDLVDMAGAGEGGGRGCGYLAIEMIHKESKMSKKLSTRFIY